MSEGELLRKKEGEERPDQDQYSPIITVYEAERVDDVKVETKLKDIYTPIEYPVCGNYESPNLAPIKERKLQIGKKFAEELMKSQSSENIGFDGVYSFINQEEVSSAKMLRQKIRIVRDIREEFYEQNGQFIIEKDMFSEELSKLANISFQSNDSIQYFQKNAILSERNNQKKQTPYTMELCFGGLWLNKHPLNNEEEREFEKLRKMLKEWATRSIHPSLPELSRQLGYLERMKQDLNERDGDMNEQINKKIDFIKQKYSGEKSYLQTLLKEIVTKNEELKDIRKKTGMETVPWRLNIKEFSVDGRPAYDIGVTPIEVSEKVVAINQAEVEKQEKRREEIRDQVYFARVFANNQYVGKTDKFKLQWPSFRVPLFQKLSIMVYTAPATLKVEVVKNGFIDQVVDVIYLAVPGVKAKTLTSSEKKYAATMFSQNGKDFRRKMKEEKKDEEIETEAPTGILLHRIEWKGEGNKMPILAPKTAEEETQCTEVTEVDQENIEEELFDCKDPRIPHKSQRERVEAGIRRAGNALLPFVDIQSARHLLLKMKNVMPQLQKIQIPLLQEQINNREDLQHIIENQQNKRNQGLDASTLETYNPLEGIFRDQPEIVLEDIRETLAKIKMLKAISSGTGAGSIRFKITEQIINQFIFEQEESPLAVFFKNLFTQKRKLGPQVSKKMETKTKIDELQINFHVRSAKNMPIREISFDRIKNFQEEENKFKMQQMAQITSTFFDRFGGYGQGFFRQQPSINMHGNTFFSAFQNQGGRTQEVSYNDHLQLDRANTFMELRFKKITKRTRCFEGPFPEWNETMVFNYSMKTQQSNAQKILMNGEQSIKVYVFDMFEQSKPTQAISELRVNKTKMYLGRFDIPFSFVLAVPSISGLFKLDRPLIQFGYGIKRSGLFDPDMESPEEMSKTENPDLHTYINLDLFTEPVVDNMIAYNSDRKAMQGGENPQILQAATQWLQDLNTKRYVRMWLNNLQGSSIFICRYLSDNVRPPKLVGEGGIGSMIERSARYVSLIPKKFNCKLLQGTEQFHMKCDQFLNIKIGEDHGILLCNYFNSIDKDEGRRDIESVLMICKVFPYGKCIFVLRRNKVTNNCQIWDPYRGECYYNPAKEYDTFCCFIKYEKQIQNFDRAKDPCPIIEVSCLVSKDNVYYNLQDSVKPPTIDFNFDDETLWKPFLNERSRADLFQKGVIETIQKNITFEFYPEVQRLQAKLQTQLFEYMRETLSRQRINHFRSYTFKVNSRISEMITRQLLPLCEHFKVDHRIIGAESTLYNERARGVYEQAVAKLQEERDRIKTEIHHDKNIYGFTLNMTYTTPFEILEKVIETQTHLVQNEDVEFVLGVRCFQYPGHLISVWVFIGTIG